MRSIINSSNIDFIIDEDGQRIYGADGKEIAGEKQGHVKMKGNVKSISLYVQTGDPYANGPDQFVRLYLSAYDIKTLHEKILEIEAKRFEDVYNDLPW